MIKLIFIILNDTESKNTLKILYFLNEYITELNKKNYYIEILPITKETVNTDKFKHFRQSNNIQSIPAILIVNNNETTAISDSKNIGEFLENIIKNKTVSKPPLEQIDDNSSDEDISQNYLNKEIFNRENDKEDILSTGHNDNSSLHSKMKEFCKKKNIDSNMVQTNSNSIETTNLSQNNTNEQNYSSKLYNNSMNKQSHRMPLKKMIQSNSNSMDTDDDRLISSKFLDNNNLD